MVNPQTDVHRPDLRPALDSAAGAAQWEAEPEAHEQFRRMRGLLLAQAPPHLSLAIASINDPLASSWVASHLAWAFAEHGESSLVAFGRGEKLQAGLRGTGNAALDLDLGGGPVFQIRSTQRSHICFLEWCEGGGATVPALALSAGKLRDLSRVLLIACEPLACSAQCIEMARGATGVLLVLNGRQDSRAEVERQTSLLKRSGLRIVGAVLNNRERPMPSAIERML